MKEKIKRYLNLEKIEGLDLNTKEELIEKLFIYHEELIYQNQELKKKNYELIELKEEYQNLFNSAPLIYLYIDADEKIKKFNYMAEKTFPNLKKGDKLSDMILPESQDDYYFHFKDLFKNKKRISAYLSIELEDGIHYYKLISQPLAVDKKHFVCILSDETDEKIAYKKIEELGLCDSLTKVYNRRFFNQELKKINNEKKLPIGFIVVDINGLKLVNDTFGHLIGDELLIKTAELLKSELRDDDVIARLGGDEFACIITNVSGEILKEIFNRVSNSLKRIPLKDLYFSAAVGFSSKDKIEISYKEVLKKAEDIMYQKKLFMRTNYHKNAIKGIIATLHEKHPREKEHSSRVQEYMEKFIEIDELNIKNESILKTVGLLHDIGKIALDYSILEKKEKLTEEEYRKVKKHPEVGYRILKSAGVHGDILEAVLYHHERYDGAGYPKGLKGDSIPLLARLLTICDAYDAMTSERPYKKKMTSEEAVNELIANKVNQFDPDLVEIFINRII